MIELTLKFGIRLYSLAFLAGVCEALYEDTIEDLSRQFLYRMKAENAAFREFCAEIGQDDEVLKAALLPVNPFLDALLDAEIGVDQAERAAALNALRCAWGDQSRPQRST